MASDICTGGTPSASSAYYPAASAFDDSPTTYWAVYPYAGEHWCKYDLGAGREQVARQYSYARGSYGSYLTDWKFQGSNDDTNWDDLDAQTGQVCDAGVTKLYSIGNTTAYRYYRWLISGCSSNDLGVAEFAIFADLPKNYLHARRDRLNLRPISTQNCNNE